MADYSITIEETLKVYGPRLTNFWGTMQWGTDAWLYVSDLETNIFQDTSDETASGGAYDDHITLTDSFTFKMFKVVDMGGISPTDSIVKFTQLGARNYGEITLSGSNDDVNLRDSEGYYHIFTYPTEDAEDQSGTGYTQDDGPDTSWDESSDPSTDWSDA